MYDIKYSNNNIIKKKAKITAIREVDQLKSVRKYNLQDELEFIKKNNSNTQKIIDFMIIEQSEIKIESNFLKEKFDKVKEIHNNLLSYNEELNKKINIVHRIIEDIKFNIKSESGCSLQNSNENINYDNNIDKLLNSLLGIKTENNNINSAIEIEKLKLEKNKEILNYNKATYKYMLKKDFTDTKTNIETDKIKSSIFERSEKLKSTLDMINKENSYVNEEKNNFLIEYNQIYNCLEILIKKVNIILKNNNTLMNNYESIIMTIENRTAIVHNKNDFLSKTVNLKESTIYSLKKLYEIKKNIDLLLYSN